MINNRFEIYKLTREIKRNGTNVTIKRQVVNEFNEQTNDVVELGSLTALYHERNEPVIISIGDTTGFRSKKTPMLVTTADEFEKVDVQIRDIFEFNGKCFRVIGVINIQEWNKIYDFTLEEFDYGKIQVGQK
jgi:hypothetical protein